MDEVPITRGSAEEANRDAQRMTPGGKPYDLKERTFLFARRVIKIVRGIPLTPEGEEIRSQFADSGTGIGANVEEADAALTRKERRQYFGIARRCCGETRFWLRLLEADFPQVGPVRDDLREVEELIRILSALVSKL